MIRRLLHKQRRRRRLRRLVRLRRRRAWRGACAGGAPVPDESRCGHADCESEPLTTLRPGQTATVTCLQDPASARTFKLATLGILPGTHVELLQRYPAFVLRMGYTELALDAELAARVRIQRD